MYPSIGRHNTDLSTSSSGSRYSQESQDSRSTAPTSIHSNPGAVSSKNGYEMSPATTYCARSSTETYASTIASQEEISEEPDTYDPEYEVPEYREVVETNLNPTNPSNFADYFPSAKRLYVRHDDTAYDGNMNLRVDTEALGREKGNVQLFHLRMHDLKKREFSLRRYERSSGREVCHSSRKYTKSAADQRPAFTRSMSNAFANIRRPDFKHTKSGLSTHGTKSRNDVKRQDSGYVSNEEEDEDEVEEFIAEQKSNGLPIPTNTTKLEFSNYSQVLVKRRGKKSSSKRYEFEYWGHTYTWKRVVEKDGAGKAVSYHLFKGESTHAVAHIVPEMRSLSQIRAEDAAGGWVPPCSMWISDHSVLEALTDVAEVVVATGLIALVDDCIKHHFHSKKHSHQVSVPLTPLKYEVKFVSPKAMVQHIFKRKNSSTSEGKKSPLSQTSFGAAC
ncbi:hypothetical protein LHYA1_G005736 [Lachnellula hyalina]|uniref:Uncharacterized protein n=1 Tax=Lachnellula hyalina TaxID=1316788 RepID=A0A8H8TYJ9_9HELO|nr:uncharacterized protein LHYA1_G005736 [Lachnellula hyalina]TVY25465.1 hypothetical protein LHYA1_G005736 [Lachnellula hyalina]